MTLYTIDENRTVDLPPATKPMLLWGASETADAPRAVVTLQVAMTRDMLAVALDLAAGNDHSNPDTWSVQRIREDVEFSLASEPIPSLQRDAETFADLLDDPSIRERIQAEYRAIDRAYPLYAPKES
ncbi:hypothetical protein AQF52_4408 [Streptomyces venezuelae]|uniref:hypothetical protein n=1 Tax=Streptomyces gardneri TaxID=66892 RepID=UPI0006BD95F4|nr:hypothetical protein [Streptomyces gardneri]ALO10002.1 hypothetical protein AQF52_4408 [Streptomyces venezuelae]QPK47041.1 hypothetical protein H4W23_22115 [Streptomyces gardneri]WRK38458.1 hypothetical protein U0M97_22215 [Streptomyces venezuelae]CUM39552.1 hypothetical protein BN2537_8069 [Streptomyces venezuelae]